MGGAQVEVWISTMVGNAANSILPVATVLSGAGDAQRDLAWLMQVADQTKNSANPFAAYAHCLCKAE